jgi:pimeloyl-ACP methyl ester carboxylesterase
LKFDLLEEVDERPFPKGTGQSIRKPPRAALRSRRQSQGAIMALETTQQMQAVAGRVIAIAGRFAEPPRSAAPKTRLHLIHGEQDAVIPAGYTLDAASRLERLGSEVTKDLIPMLGHAPPGLRVHHISWCEQASPNDMKNLLEGASAFGRLLSW